MTRIGFEFIQVFIAHSRERMVHGDVAFFFFAVFKHREVDDPGESEFVFVDEVHAAGHFFAQFAKSGCYDFRFVGDHEDQVAFFSAAGFTDFKEFVFAEEFLDLRFQRAVFEEADPSETFSAVVADVFDEAVQFAARNVASPLTLMALT